ncbi:MAG: metallophosphoesterase family protein [Rhodobiaceae bacterium]|nr:metallophosphoesterase family protein [Rhodobiaceae bacterium]
MPPADSTPPEFDAPILVFGGVYSNFEAFEALIAEAGRLGIPPARMIHTGDVIAYGADPEACARSLRDLGCLAISGNVEQQLAAGAADCGCGFEAGTTCDALSAAWYAHADPLIGADLRRWMAGLPDRLTLEMAGLTILVVHGTPSSVNRFIYLGSPDAAVAEELAMTDADIVLCGHSGFPMVRSVGGQHWINTGAIGFPANDGTARGWFAVLEPADDGVAVEIRPLAYDHALAAEKMRRAGLPEPYAAALEGARAPNHDTLPEADRARAGTPLQFERTKISARTAPGVARMSRAAG